MSRIFMKLAVSEAAALPWGMTGRPVRNLPRSIDLRERHRLRRTFDAKPFESRLPAKRLDELEPEGWYPKPRAAEPRRFSATGFLWTAFGSLREGLHRRAEQRALSKATFMLGSAPDGMLKDIGVSRCEVVYSVRHGRDRDPAA